MQRVRQPNRSVTNADRARSLLEAVRRRIERGESSHPELKASVFRAFERMFTELSEPNSKAEPLMAMGVRDPKQYNEMVDAFEADINAAAQDAKNLSDSIVSTFNFSSVLAKQLDTRVKKVTSKSQDLQLLSETFAEDTVVAGDDFADDSRIDKQAALDVQLAELPANDNTIVLKREQGENVMTDQEVTIRILSTFRIYEGLFYAPNGEARPEGGKFHFTGSDNSLQSDTTAPGAPADLKKRYNNWRSDPSLPAQVQTPDGAKNRADITAKQAYQWAQSTGSWGPFSTSEWDMLANNYHIDPAFADEPGLLKPTPREVETDKGAPLSERSSIRQNMIDDDPDTFWECEYIVDASEALTKPASASGTQPSGAPSNDAGSTTPGQQITNGVPGSTDNQGNSPPAETGTGGGQQITLGELIDKITGPAIDKIDLDCTIILELSNPKIVNWINLLPHNFSDSTWLEVLDVSTSLDGANWEEIDGLKNQQHENILTPEANSELTENEVSVTLAPNKFQYSGQGVWTFSAREVKFIRIKLLQKTPIPAPYDILKVDMTQTMTATHTGHRGTESTTFEYNKTEEMGYLETLKITAGEKDTNGLETNQQSSTNITRDAGSTTADTVRNVFDPGQFLHTPSQEASTTHDYSGWTVKDQYFETKWDKARYSIGIKEIGVWAYIYSEKSGFVSIPFKTPKPIQSLSLHTDEIVPNIFTKTKIQPWIKYWVSFNDGEDWTQIVPANQGALNLVDGIRIPQTIHVNSGIPEEERDPRAGYVDLGVSANSVRLKAILERPPDYTDMTPVLKAYRLRMIMRGGL